VALRHHRQEGIFQIGRSLNWRDGYKISLIGHWKCRHLYTKSAAAHGYQSLSRYTERARRKNLIETVADFRRCELSHSLLIQIKALAISETTLVMRWMRDNMDESVDEIRDGLVSIVPHQLFLLLDKPFMPTSPR
jgi:hypothetical protein